MTAPTHRTRQHAVLQVRRQLESESFPRLQMGLIVALTGGAGLLASFLLLHAGMDAMAWRYPLAVLVAYGFFLFLLWLWLRTNTRDYVDPSLMPDAMPSGSPASPRWASGRGGDFAGGGASGSFDDMAAGTSELVASQGAGSGDGLGAAFDGDVSAIPLMVLVMAVGMAFASLYVIYAAPALLAELLFDGVLSYTLYRRLRNLDSPHWLATAVRRTALAFGLTAVCLAAVGWALGAYAPGARSVGDVARHAGTPR